MTTGIYKITAPDLTVYIGQAKNIEKRWTRYKTDALQKHPRLYASALVFGIDNFTFEIVKECAVDELNEWERFYQDLYDVCGEKGLNCKLTPTKDKKGFYSEEMRAKMSKNASKPTLGKMLSEETKAKISKANMGHTYNLGQKRSAEFCKQMKDLNAAKCKKIRCNETGDVYNSIYECAKITKLGRSCIQRSIKSGFSAKGLTFSEINEDGISVEKNHKPILSKKGPKIAKKIMCLQSGKIFDSLNSCSVELSISCGALSSHIRHGSPKSVKGKTFRYLTAEEISLVPHKKRHKKSSLSTLSRTVINLESGVFYESLKMAADAHNFKYQTLYCMLSGQNPNRTNLIYA